MRRVITGLLAAVWLTAAMGAAALTADELIAGITDASADTRLNTALRAGALGAAGVEILKPYLEAESWETRKAAFTALDQIVKHAMRPDAPASELRAAAAAVTALSGEGYSEELRREALRLAGLAGSAAEVPVIAPLLTDLTLGDAARMALTAIPGATADQALINALHAATPAVQARIALSLAMRQSEAAIPTLIELARTADPTARWDLVDALARLGVMPTQVLQVSTGFSRDDQERYMQAAFTAADVLAGRGEVHTAQRVYVNVLQNTTQPHLIAYALTGLGRVGSDVAAANCIAYLAHPRVHTAAARVLTELEREDTDERLATAYAHVAPAQQAAILEVLVARNSVIAPTLLRQGQQSDSAVVRVAARRLAGEDQVAEDLLAAASDRAGYRSEDALRDVLALARDAASAGRKDAARSTYESVAAGAFDDAWRVEAVQALAALANAESLPVLENLANNTVPGDLRSAVQKARIAITAAAHPSGIAVPGVLEVARLDDDPGVLAAARDALAALGAAPELIAQERGYITHWEVLGPFAGTSEVADFNPASIPSAWTAGDETVSMRHADTSDVPAAIDLRGLYARARDVSAYAGAELWSAAEQPVRFVIASDEGATVYLNGKLIVSAPETPNQKPVKIDHEAVLALGRNTLVLHLPQRSDDWYFSVQILLADGRPWDVSAQRILDDSLATEPLELQAIPDSAN